jgi:hypothetical protein
MEVDEFNFTVKIFNQRRATLDPIAGVQVNHVADIFNFRAMNVSANHAVNILFPRGLDNRVFVIAHIFDSGFGFVFQISRDGPITKTEHAADAVKVKIEIQNPIVEPRADAIEQAVEMRDAVKLMPVQHEIAFSIGGGVDDFARNHHAAEIHAEKLFEKFVVIAGDVNDLRFLAAFAKKFLNEHVVVVIPVPLGFQLPAVEKIADEIKIAAFGLAQKIEQLFDLRVFGAEMNVGNPDRAVAPRTYAGRLRCLIHKNFFDT